MNSVNSVKTMKARSLALVALFAVVALTYAADPLNEALQKGLLEEEANHNLDAAIQAYQTAVTQYDTQRQVAATALFRIAECYRKQAKTNEAAPFYQRVVRDFSDQTKLVELSRPHVLKAPRSRETQKSADELAAIAEEYQNATSLRQQELAAAVRLYEQGKAEEIAAQNEYANLEALTETVANTDTPEALPVEIADESYVSVKKTFESWILAPPPEGADKENFENFERHKKKMREKMKMWLLEVWVKKQTAAMRLADRRASDAQRRAREARQSQVSLREELEQLAQNIASNHSLTRRQLQLLKEGKLGSDPLLRELNLPAPDSSLDTGKTVQTDSAPGGLAAQLELEWRKAEAELSAVSMRAFHYAKLSSKDLRQVLLTSSGDSLLTSLMDTLSREEQKLAQRRPVFGADHPDLVQLTAGIKEINTQIDERVQGYLTGLQTQAEVLRARAESFKKEAEAARSGTAPPEPSAATEEEAKEIQRIKALVRSSPDLINAKAQNDYAPLHSAAAAGQLAVAQFLLGNGAEVDLPGIAGNRPLHYAAGAGHKAMVELLLAHGADVNARDGMGETPLHDAAKRGYRTVATTLLDNRADPNAKDVWNLTPLHRASWAGYLSVVQDLVAHGADVNARLDRSRPRSPTHDVQNLAELRDGETPLHLAVRAGHKDVMEFLFANGANLQPARTGGESPLSAAVRASRPAIAGIILRKQQEAGVRDPDLDKLLLFTAGSGIFGREELFRLLLAAGADPNVKEENGFTALMQAINTEASDIAKALLEMKVDINAKRTDGWTALHFAASRGSKEIVELLLARGADVNLVTADGQTPLRVAISRKQVAEQRRGFPPPGEAPQLPASQTTTPLEMVDLLRKHGAKE